MARRRRRWYSRTPSEPGSNDPQVIEARRVLREAEERAAALGDYSRLDPAPLEGFQEHVRRIPALARRTLRRGVVTSMALLVASCFVGANNRRWAAKATFGDAIDTMGVCLAVAFGLATLYSLCERGNPTQWRSVTDRLGLSEVTSCAHRVPNGLRRKQCWRCVASMLERASALASEVEQAKVNVQKALDNMLAREEAERQRRQEARERAETLREQERRIAAQTIAGLRHLSPTEFERLVGDLYAAMGFTVTVTKASGDDGVDVIASKSGRTKAVQCKRYGDNTKVGRPEVQMLYGAMTHIGADSCAIVTTSDFTQQAREAANKLGVQLIDQDKLLELLRAHRLG